MNKNIVIGITSIIIGVGCLMASVSAATPKGAKNTTLPCGNTGSSTDTPPFENFGSGKMMQQSGSSDAERLMMQSGGLDERRFGSSMTHPEGTGTGMMDRGMIGSGMISPCEDTNTQATTGAKSTNTKTTPTQVSTGANTKLQALRERIAKIKAERLAKQKQITTTVSAE